ncbi:hypothetical protein [Halomicrococcus gelatinilyticus]|uniref:hypothetical protein n=1 Tax=Halomicrococcus gelatinilyticus TaxID=1702103 RepID=UPI002E1068A1
MELIDLPSLAEQDVSVLMEEGYNSLGALVAAEPAIMAGRTHLSVGEAVDIREDAAQLLSDGYDIMQEHGVDAEGSMSTEQLELFEDELRARGWESAADRVRAEIESRNGPQVKF